MTRFSTITSRLGEQTIELPSWAFGNSGTRFKVFSTPGTPRTPQEKIADAAQVNEVTALAPSVALHIPWDKVDDYAALRTFAEDHGVKLGTVNSNTFQDDDYKFGSLTHIDPRIRQKAIDHHLECLDIMNETGSRDLKIWLADGSNYPGQQDIRGRQDRLAESLATIYDRVGAEQRLVLEYKFFEPAFYHTDVPDWGTSYVQVAALGERAVVCLDTGHHAPGTNIEFIVAQLLRLGKLGSFDFNSRFYADDDLIVGAADPFQLFRILYEVIRGGGYGADGDVAFMLDQCHNVEDKISGQIRSVLNVQEMTARALLVDADALAQAQTAGDVLGANGILMDAFYTDVRADLADWRESRGLPRDPFAAYLASGYQQRIAEDRVGGTQAVGEHELMSTESISQLLPPKQRRRTRIGLVAGGLGTYWPQFPGLLPQLQESARYVAERFESMDADVTDAGFISDAQEGVVAAEKLRLADCDLIVMFLTTYLTSSMVLPIAQRANTPILVIDLQPTEKMDHANFDTGLWLAYCGQCPVPEVGNVFRRAGIPFRSVSGWLRQESAWERIGQWIRAAHIRAALRDARHGLMGHVYPGMLDVSTDLTLLPTTFGSHVEVLEFDDLRQRVERVTDAETEARMDLTRQIFTLDDSVKTEDFAWGARVSVGLDRLIDDFDLDSLAYYHRGLDGEQHERLGAGMILGASLLTARGIPATGEYELRTTVAQLATQVIGAGGSFTEIQALNFEDSVVEMGHDGPAHLAVSSRDPLLRGLGIYHGKRGFGVSVEFDVQPGPVTLLGLGQDRDGALAFVASEGTVVPGPLLAIGNTTSRVDFDRDPGVWVDEWSATGIGHHWSLSIGHRAADYRAAASLLGIDFRQV